MGWAIDWGSIAYVNGSSQYKAVISPDVPAPGNGIGNVQANAIYVTFPSADFDFSEMTAAGISYSQIGAGIFFNLSNFATVSEMSVTIGNTYNAVKTTYTLTVHNDNPLVVPSAKAPTPTTPAQRVRAVYSQYPLNAGMTMLGWSSAMTKTDVIVDGRTFPSFQFGNYLGLGYGPMNVSMMDNIHLDIWTENSFNINFFLISPGTENYYTIELTGGTWNSVNIPLSTFTADKTRVTEFKFADASVAGQKIFVDNIYFYANDDLPNPDPSEVEDTNFALRTNGSVVYASTILGENYPARAIDGDNGTQWESVWDNDPQWMIVDFGQRRIFNTVKIYWGNQWAREFYLETSNNGTDWTEVKHITDNTSDHNNSEQSFQLDANATARYIRFRGIVRANGYGYTIKEFGALLAGVPVLASVGLSSNKEIVKIGEFAALTAEPKDQNNQAIAATLSYEVSPDLGHVTDGKYYPDKYGLATITVTAEAGGVQVTNSVQILGVSSDNLALDNALTDVGTYYGGDTQAKAVDGDDGSVWQGCTTNTTSEDQASRTYDAWFVVDLKGAYTLQFVTIHFEGACSDSYKLYGSTNNVDWAEIYSYEYPNPQQGNRTWDHTDKISADVMANAENVRYLKFISSRAASQWGVKIYELQVFGEEYIEAGVDVTGITLDKTAATVEIGESLTLTATVSPYNATIKTVTWKSSDETVATVVDGVITTLKDGTADITATANDGSGVFATCALTVEPITAKTWWGTKTITEWDPDMDVMWSVTRNVNKTLTYTVYFGGDASGKVKQLNDGVGGTDGWHDLSGYTDENRVASYTTTATYEKGAPLSPKPFFYFGGPRIDLPTSYRVADTNDKPATSVSSVSLNHTSASLEPTEQLQLIVTILPSFVENKAVTWESSNSTIASVTDAGLVTANAVGTATITATSSADGTKTATCTITVVGDLSPETWYGYGKFDVHGKWVAFSYSITRTAERNLYYQTHLSADIAGIAMKINYNDNWYTMSQDESKRNATYTEEGPFVDGNAHNFYFRAEFENGADNNNVTYTIGSFNDALGQAIAIDESADNTSIITAYDEQSVVGIVKRSFTSGSLYTLVLPFDVDAAQTAAKLPGQLTKLNNSYLKENGDLRINFVDANAIEAGVPYLYQPSADVTNPTFEGVTVSATLHHTKPADGYAEYHGIYAPMEGVDLHALPDAYVLGSDQYLYAVSDLPDTQTMKALRAYFVLDFPSAASGAPKRLAKVVFNSQETEVATGIENTIDNEQNTKILRDGQLLIIREGKTYNAQGQLIK